MNKLVPHVFVLPEDDANRQLANGFVLDGGLDGRRIQILEEAGGWMEVLNRFKEEHIPTMERNGKRFIILLLDFDQDGDRLGFANSFIPDQLRDRVFVLGVWSEPEDLRKQSGNSYETIGKTLAKDCRENARHAWEHKLLAHNAGELERLRKHVYPILFGKS